VPQDVLGKVRTLKDSPLIFRGKNLQVGVVAGRAGSGIKVGGICPGRVKTEFAIGKIAPKAE